MVLLEIQKIPGGVLGGKRNISFYNHLLTRIAPISSNFQLQSLAEQAVPMPAEGCCSVPHSCLQHLSLQPRLGALQTPAFNLSKGCSCLGDTPCKYSLLNVRSWPGPEVLSGYGREGVCDGWSIKDGKHAVNDCSRKYNFFESFLCENMRRVIRKANKYIHLEWITSHWDTQASH